MTQILTRRVSAVCLAAIVLTGAAVARAAPSEQETIAQVVELNREGVAQYQKKHFDAARKVLKEALELCERAGLDHHPVAARTHIHLGIVIIAGFGQREIGSRQFSEALLIDPNITLTPGLETPAAQDVFNEVMLAVSPKAAAPGGAATPAEASTANAAPAVEGAPVERPVAAQKDDDGGADEVTRAERRVTRPSAAHDGDGEDGDNDAAATPSLESRFQLGALLGGGVGWASGTGDVNADQQVPGSFAVAKLGHVALETGYWWKPEVMLSLQGRFQLVTGPTIVEANDRTYRPANYAAAVFGAATWSPAMGPLRPFVSGSIGAGRIRHVVTLPSLKDCGASRTETCVDTVGAGPFLAGVGGGVTYPLTDRLVLVGALNTQLGAPTFTFNVDIDAGVALRL